MGSQSFRQDLVTEQQQMFSKVKSPMFLFNHSTFGIYLASVDDTDWSIWCSDAQKSAVFEEPFDSLVSLLVAFVDYDNFKLSRLSLIFSWWHSLKISYGTQSINSLRKKKEIHMYNILCIFNNKNIYLHGSLFCHFNIVKIFLHNMVTMSHMWLLSP